MLILFNTSTTDPPPDEPPPPPEAISVLMEAHVAGVFFNNP